METKLENLRTGLLGKHGALSKVMRKLGQIEDLETRKLVASYLEDVKQEVSKELSKHKERKPNVL